MAWPFEPQSAAEVIDVIVTGGGIAAGVWAGNFVIRSGVMYTLRHFGAYDPRFDYYWPRLPWRPLIWRPYIAFKEWWEESFSMGRRSTAGFASWLTQLSSQLKPGDMLLGRVRLPFSIPWYAPVGQKITRHCIIVASTGSGKSVHLATVLGMLPKGANAFVVDPKGTFSKTVLPGLEEQGWRIVVIDPYRIVPGAMGSINMLMQIAELSRRIGQDVTTLMCDRIAATDIPNTESKNPFFRNTARLIWAALMAHVISTMPRGSMIDARRLLCVGYIERANGDSKIAMNMLWRAMAENPAWDGYISRLGHQMLELEEKTRNDVLATARTYTKYLDHEQVRRVSERNDVFLSDLKREDSDLILSLVAPVTELRTTLQPWFAQVTALALATFELIPGNLSERCRFILEELQAFGGVIFEDRG